MCTSGISRGIRFNIGGSVVCIFPSDNVNIHYYTTTTVFIINIERIVLWRSDAVSCELRMTLYDLVQTSIVCLIWYLCLYPIFIFCCPINYFWDPGMCYGYRYFLNMFRICISSISITPNSWYIVNRWNPNIIHNAIPTLKVYTPPNHLCDFQPA